MNRIRPAFSNPIIRRIRRHASFATLFRYSISDPAERARRYPQDYSIAYAPPLPGGEAAAEPPVYTPLLESPARPAEIQSAQKIEQVAPPVPSAGADRQQPAVPVASPASPAVSKKEVPSILRRLQERFMPPKKAPAAQKVTPQAAPVVPGAALRPADALPKIPVQLPSVPQSQVTPVVVSPQAAAPPAAAPPAVRPHLAQPVVSGVTAPATVPVPLTPQVPLEARAMPTPAGAKPGEDANWKRLQTIMRKHEEKQAAEQAHSVSAPVLPVEQASRMENIPAAAPLAEPEQLRVLPTEPRPEEGPYQALPLEAVWPVERSEVKPGLPVKAAPSPGTVTPTSPPPALPAETEEVLRQVVQRAKTGQPTDSHVEVIMPRAARPAAPSRATPVAAAAPESPVKKKAEPEASEPADTKVRTAPAIETVSPETPESSVAVDAAVVQREQVGTPLEKLSPQEEPSIEKTPLGSASAPSGTTAESGQPAVITAQPGALQPAPQDTLRVVRPVQPEQLTGEIAEEPVKIAGSSAVEPALSSRPEPIEPVPPLILEPARTESSLTRATSKPAAPTPTSSSSSSQPVAGQGPTPIELSSAVSRTPDNLLPTASQTPSASIPTARAVPPTAVQPIREAGPSLSPPLLPEQPPPEVFQPQIQRLDASTTRTAPSVQPPTPAFVQTEIGPLPGDLWTLLDQEPPAQSTAPVPQAEEPSQGGTEQPSPVHPAAPTAFKGAQPAAPSRETPTSFTAATAQPRKEVPAVQGQTSSVRTVQRHPMEGIRNQVLVDDYRFEEPTSFVEPAQPPVIQRAESTESAQSGGESPAAAPAEGDTQAPSLSDKDLDALARQVYAEIRKKLSVERERTRRR